MRVLIMADMEGVSGIISWKQVTGGEHFYDECRRLYTEEVNAAIRGAFAAGATEVVAVDCHGAGNAESGYRFNSFVPELLDERCDWVAGHTWGRYTEFLEAGADACLLIGMHGRAHTPDAVLSHTISTVNWANMWFNEDHVGELGINAALCGHFGCPCVMVTGDEATCREGREILGNAITTVAVKRGFGRFSARQIAPLRARRLIEEGARRALSNIGAVKPYVPAAPTTIRFTVHSVDKLDAFRGRPRVELLDHLTIRTQGENWMDAWNNIWPY